MVKVYAEYRFDAWEYHSFDSISIRIIEQLNSIDERVFKYSRHFRSAPDWSMQSGDIVIAICTAWNKWFRARILSHDDAVDLVNVRAIDYGQEFDLPKQCIFPLLDKQLASIEPVRPIRIGIHGIKRTEQHRWTKQVKLSIETFVNFPAIKLFRCLEVKDDRFLGDIIISSKGKCLSDMLVDMGYAVRTGNESSAAAAGEHVRNNGASSIGRVPHNKSSDCVSGSSKSPVKNGRDEKSPAATGEIMAGIFSSTKLDSASMQSSEGKGDFAFMNGDISVPHEQKNESRESTAGIRLQIGSKLMSSGIQECDAGYKTPSFERINDDVRSPSDTSDNELSDVDTIGNSDTDSSGIRAPRSRHGSGSVSDFDFDNCSVGASSVCSTIKDIQPCKQVINRLRAMETTDLPNDIKPLKELSLIDTKTICIGDEPSHFNRSNCFKEFLPVIAKQLRGLPRTYPLQEVAWPHLLKGRSAIIIDPSDHLADLLYLPVICTHIEKSKESSKRYGPQAIIICNSQDRCIEIAKRYLSFSSGGYMTNSNICCTRDEFMRVPDAQFKACKFFVMTTFHCIRYDRTILARFGSCNSVQKIVFDSMDYGNLQLFEDVIEALKVEPEQIIVTSRFWRPVHRGIYNSNLTREYLIFGAPLDVAIAANSKFGVLFAKKDNMFVPTSPKYKLELILSQVQGSSKQKFSLAAKMRSTGKEDASASLIIFQDGKDMDVIRNELQRANIECHSGNDGEFSFHICRVVNSKDVKRKVYCCISRMLPSLDLSNVSHYFIYDYFTKANNRPEIQHMAKIFQSKLKPDIHQFTLPTSVTITFFCLFNGMEFETCLQAESFFNYQRFMQCPKFWSHVSNQNILPCSRFRIPKENLCDATVEDELQQRYADISCIRFQILHFYSPLHFKVEIFAQFERSERLEGELGAWNYLASQSEIVDIYRDGSSPYNDVKNTWEPKDFDDIFHSLDDPYERLESYEAMPTVKKERLCVRNIRLSNIQRCHKDKINQNQTPSFITNYRRVQSNH